jgi:hypothetical protein
MFFLLLLFFIIGRHNVLSGQRFQTIKQAEDSLAVQLISLNLAQDDSSKNAINQCFSNTLEAALHFPSSDNYPFESLKTLVKITSPDQKFRIFHWNLPRADGKSRFFGFLKMLGHDPALIYPLIDGTDSLQSPDTSIVDNLHWFGALYYKVILQEAASGEKIYTLLGWAGKYSMITQKVIEILSFNDEEKPRFGMKIFPDFQAGKMNRIIFRFAATTTMSLKYEKQTISTNKKWNSKTRVFDYSPVETQLIVFDRMVPPDPLLAGQYQFYVAAGDIFDGFIFKQYQWRFMEGIDARNKK